MTLRKYLIGMFVSTILCWFSFGLILTYIDPFASGFVGLFCFYISLFFATIGTLTIIGYLLRVWLSKNEILYAHIGPAFRHGVLLSIILVVSLILQSFRLLTWWDAGLFIATIALLEFFFLSRKKTFNENPFK